MYDIHLDSRVSKDLAKIHSTIVTQIQARIYSHLAHFPRELGKPLKGELKGFYTHRHGDYRILYRIFEREKTLLITNIEHRKDVYE